MDKENKGIKDNPGTTALVQIEANRVRIEGLEGRFDRFMDNDFHSLQKDVREIKDKLMRRLPWGAAITIWLLSSIVVALAARAIVGG